QALQIDPFNAEAISDRASTYRDNGDFARAIADQTKIIKDFADSADTRSERGLTYLASHQLDSALENFDAAIGFERKNAALYTNRGAVYREMGKLSLAIADYSQAIDI